MFLFQPQALQSDHTSAFTNIKVFFPILFIWESKNSTKVVESNCKRIKTETKNDVFFSPLQLTVFQLIQKAVLMDQKHRMSTKKLLASKKLPYRALSPATANIVFQNFVKNSKKWFPPRLHDSLSAVLPSLWK